MFRHIGPIARGGAFLVATLLMVSSANAQPSASGHAVAPGYRPAYSSWASTPRVYPGDRGYHSTMQIQQYYQVRERIAPVVQARRAAAAEAAETPAAPIAQDVAVTIGDSKARPVMIAIRGPDGEVRSYPLAGGREAIRARTIIVHPGEKLTIRIQNATVQAPNKK
jgi:hypothetical protein